MKYLKLFEDFSEDFKYDFSLSFGEGTEDFYAEVNLKDRIIRVEMLLEETYDPVHGKSGSWLSPKVEIDSLIKGSNEPLLEMINTYLLDAYENRTIPEHVLIDGEEEIEKVNDITFLAKLKIRKEKYNDWVIKTRGPSWSKRTGKKYGL